MILYYTFFCLSLGKEMKVWDIKARHAKTLPLCPSGCSEGDHMCSVCKLHGCRMWTGRAERRISRAKRCWMWHLLSPKYWKNKRWVLHNFQTAAETIEGRTEDLFHSALINDGSVPQLTPWHGETNWNKATGNVIIHTCAFSALTRQNVCCKEVYTCNYN